jgi:hypothetical protein
MVPVALALAATNEREFVIEDACYVDWTDSSGGNLEVCLTRFWWWSGPSLFLMSFEQPTDAKSRCSYEQRW